LVSAIFFSKYALFSPQHFDARAPESDTFFDGNFKMTRVKPGYQDSKGSWMIHPGILDQKAGFL